ncbi:MAG TPA: DUF5777 family beta-barrel protein [Cyclobacteriaceae bacterium]|nr:DUF5777 family beta-barrel protein [Cyclobacteriaceae bacterium]
MKKNIVLTFVLSAFFALTNVQTCFSQDDLLAGLKANSEVDPGYVTSTFKSTRVINSHSVETLAKGNLDFRISHRFGKLNSGAYNFFGLDEATIRLALEYGLTDRLTVGIGRSSFQKTLDGYAKVKLLRQRKGDAGSFPFSATWFSNVAYNSFRNGDELMEGNASYRYSFAHQLILARKFSPRLSLQVAPILIHRNLEELTDRSNDVFAIEGGGRIKISKRVSINADYIYRLGAYADNPYHNSFSLGVDIETGGHVFQLHFTNSQGMIEEMFVTRTGGQWSKGDIFYGFNISRQFVLKKKK